MKSVDVLRVEADGIGPDWMLEGIYVDGEVFVRIEVGGDVARVISRIRSDDDVRVLTDREHKNLYVSSSWMKREFQDVAVVVDVIETRVKEHVSQHGFESTEFFQ